MPYDTPAHPGITPDPRPVLLFDLNGTLTSHTSVRRASGTTRLRPGAGELLRRLQPHFRCGRAGRARVWPPAGLGFTAFASIARATRITGRGKLETFLRALLPSDQVLAGRSGSQPHHRPKLVFLTPAPAALSRLGIYTSSTPRTVNTALQLLEADAAAAATGGLAAAGGGGASAAVPQVFERALILHREHTEPVPNGV